MGIGPQGLGSMGMSSKSAPCGSPLNKMSDKRKARKKAKAVKNLKVPADSGNSSVDNYFNKEAREVSNSPMTKKDACYSKVVSRYGPKNSAYRSGAMAKCRKVGAANWGKSKK